MAFDYGFLFTFHFYLRRFSRAVRYFPFAPRASERTINFFLFLCARDSPVIRPIPRGYSSWCRGSPRFVHVSICVSLQAIFYSVYYMRVHARARLRCGRANIGRDGMSPGEPSALSARAACLPPLQRAASFATPRARDARCKSKSHRGGFSIREPNLPSRGNRRG